MDKDIRDRIDHDVESIFAEYLCANNCSGDTSPGEVWNYSQAIDTLAWILTTMLERNKRVRV